MNHPTQKSHHKTVAKALQDAGFVRLPNLWVRQEDMPRIRRIALRYGDEVNEIRHSVKRQLQAEGLDIDSQTSGESNDVTIGDPMLDRDAAWEAYKHQQLQIEGN